MLRHGYVTKEQLEEVLRAQRDSPQQRLSGWRLGELLVERGLMTRGQVAELVAEQYELPYLDLDPERIDPEVAALLPPEMVERFSAIPIESTADGSLVLAVSDPATVLFSDELRRTLGRPLRFAVVAPDAMEAAIAVRGGGEQPALSPSAWPSGAPSFGLATEAPSSDADEAAATPESPRTGASETAASVSYPPLGTLLVRDGLVAEGALERALEEQRLSPERRLGEILVEHGALTRADVARVVAEQYELPFVDLASFEIDRRVAALLPYDLARRYSALPLDFLADGSLRVAVADPTKVLSPEEILAALGARLSFAVADPDLIEAALERQAETGSAIGGSWATFAPVGPPLSRGHDQAPVDASDLIVIPEDELEAPDPGTVERRGDLGGGETPAAALETADAPGERELDSGRAVLGPEAEALSVPEPGADEGAEEPVAAASRKRKRRRRWLLGRKRRDGETEAVVRPEEDPAAVVAPTGGGSDVEDAITGLLLAGEAADAGEEAAGEVEGSERTSEQASVLRLWIAGVDAPVAGEGTLGATSEGEPVADLRAEASLEEPPADAESEHTAPGDSESTVESGSLTEVTALAWRDQEEEGSHDREPSTETPGDASEPGTPTAIELRHESDPPTAASQALGTRGDGRAGEKAVLEPPSPGLAAGGAAQPDTATGAAQHAQPSETVSDAAVEWERPAEPPELRAAGEDDDRVASWNVFAPSTAEQPDLAPDAREPAAHDRPEAAALATGGLENVELGEQAMEVQGFAHAPLAFDPFAPESPEVVDPELPAETPSDEEAFPASETSAESGSWLAWEPAEGAADPGARADDEEASALAVADAEPEAPHGDDDPLCWAAELAPDSPDGAAPWELEEHPPAVAEAPEPAHDTPAGEPSALDVVVGLSVPEAILRPLEPPGAARVVESGDAAENDARAAAVAEDGSILARVVERATALGASTLHFSAQAHGIVVRARVDGVLRKLDTVAGQERYELARELGVAAQGGSLAGAHVTALPTAHGETVTVRFRPSGTAATLDDLSLDPADRETVERALRLSFGLVVVAGPAGSGTAETLAAALHELAASDRAVMTIEDPVLHVVPGADQVPVDHTAGRGYADGLRTLLAADPDAILVGELADEETARLAVDAATGHLVVTRLLAQTAVGAFDRLALLGLDGDLIASTLSLVVCQRLARRLCDHCREGYYASAADTAALRRPNDEIGRRLLARGTGCAECADTGFAGTIGMYEVLVPNDEVRALVAANAPAAELERAARLAGKRTLADDAVRLCLEGLTTVSEVQRVLGRGLL